MKEEGKKSVKTRSREEDNSSDGERAQEEHRYCDLSDRLGDPHEVGSQHLATRNLWLEEPKVTSS